MKDERIFSGGSVKGRIIFAAIFMTFLISGTNLAAKAATLEIRPGAVVFLRYVIAMVTIKALLMLRGRRSVPIDRGDWKAFVLLTISGILLNQNLFVRGLKYTIPSHPSLIYATTSFWVMLLLWALKRQRPRRIHLLSAAIAFSGVGIVLGSSLLVFNAEIFRGDMIIVLAVISWATYTAFGQKMVEKYGALELTYILLGFGTAVYLPYGVYEVSQLAVEEISMAAWGGAIYMGVFTSALSYVLYYFLLGHLRATRLTLLIAAQPPTTIFLSCIAGYEELTFNLLAGTLLVILAIFISSRKAGKMGPPSLRFGATAGKMGPPSLRFGATAGKMGPPSLRFGATAGKMGPPSLRFGATAGKMGKRLFIKL